MNTLLDEARNRGYELADVTDHVAKLVAGLVAVKRHWVPEWLYRWFTPNAATREPWRSLLHREPNDIERASSRPRKRRRAAALPAPKGTT